ncbi:hypothetical protein GCM10023225_10540 [Kineococcus glutinatus]|uniref:Uncharacterized protein n=1 Tax=Kineococcus glutinatus TaxID=1070872 RepID=A0ABP9HGT0_9ACTN
MPDPPEQGRQPQVLDHLVGLGLQGLLQLPPFLRRAGRVHAFLLAPSDSSVTLAGWAPGAVPPVCPHRRGAGTITAWPRGGGIDRAIAWC